MTLVDADTGEIIAECSPEEARELTERIRDGLTLTWQLVVEAHDRRAWKAMGYPSFRRWVEGELNMSRGHAYRLLDHGRVMQALAEHAGVSPTGDIPERLTRGIPAEDAVAAAREATESLPEDAGDDEKADAVIDAMDKLRKAMTSRQQPSPSPKPLPQTDRGSEDRTTSGPQVGPSEADAINAGFERHVDPAADYRVHVTTRLNQALNLKQLDIEKAVATAGDSAEGHRLTVESIREWCDQYLAAARPAQLRRVK